MPRLNRKSAKLTYAELIFLDDAIRLAGKTLDRSKLYDPGFQFAVSMRRHLLTAHEMLLKKIKHLEKGENEKSE